MIKVAARLNKNLFHYISALEALPQASFNFKYVAILYCIPVRYYRNSQISWLFSSTDKEGASYSERHSPSREKYMVVF